MQIRPLVCVSCGAPISIGPNTQQVKCAYCGTVQIVDRSEGQVALKAVEQVKRMVEQESAQTQAELQRLDIGNQLQTAQLELANVQAEIRTLQRQPGSAIVSRQLAELRGREAALLTQTQNLQFQLQGYPAAGTAPAQATGAALSTRSWLVTFLLCLFTGIFGGHRFYTGYIVTGLLQLASMGGIYVWWLIDLYMIASNRFKDSEGKLLRNPNATGGLVGQGCVSAVALFFLIGVLLIDVAGGAAVNLGFVAGLLAFIYVVFLHARVRAALRRWTGTEE